MVRAAEAPSGSTCSGTRGSWALAGPRWASTRLRSRGRSWRRRYDEAYPDAKPGARAGHLGQIWRFLHEIEKGHQVVTYDPDQRIYLLGTVEGDPESSSHEVNLQRRVRWTQRVHRDQLSVSTRNSLGATSTLFRPGSNASEELLRLAVPLGSPVEEAPRPAPEPAPAEDSEDEPNLGDVVNRAGEFIEDRIARLDWEELQELVAGILRAMGYRTRVSEVGPDRGVDVFASPDGLGLPGAPGLRRGEAPTPERHGRAGDPLVSRRPAGRRPLSLREHGRFLEGRPGTRPRGRASLSPSST